MEAAGILDELVDDDSSCLAREACVQELFRDAPAGCLYCRLSELSDGDDD